LGKSFLEKWEIGESFFGKNHGKLAHLQDLAPKIIYGASKLQLRSRVKKKLSQAIGPDKFVKFQDMLEIIFYMTIKGGYWNI
jgi:hypothetical protein